MAIHTKSGNTAWEMNIYKYLIRLATLNGLFSDVSINGIVDIPV